jgi:hypothetical protein
MNEPEDNPDGHVIGFDGCLMLRDAHEFLKATILPCRETAIEQPNTIRSNRPEFNKVDLCLERAQTLILPTRLERPWIFLTGVESVPNAVQCLCFLPQNRNSSNARDLRTTPNGASNAKRQVQESKRK